MKLSGHYKHWRTDLSLVVEMGITHLRYGPPYYIAHAGPMKYNWDFADKTFTRLKELGVEPIVDLCHFGVPDWIGDFQNPEWPPLFADYAAAFAKRFPWVRLYTPVNEIFVCARFSAQLGWWNERLKSDRAFITALKHMARATILAEQAILRIRPDAVFIQSESSQYFHATTPDTQARAEFLNHKRFLSLDLCYGHDVNGLMHEYLLDNDLSREEYHWFLAHGSALRPHCVMGTDYYITNEYRVGSINPDPAAGPVASPSDPTVDITDSRRSRRVAELAGEISGGTRDRSGEEATAPAGEIFGYYVICHQYFDRYRLPVMHTETNRKDTDAAPPWLWKEWSNILRLKHDGVPIIGFTWYSLIDQTDWDTALREDNHRINPLGLFNLHRNIQPVGEAYRHLIQQWRGKMPMSSLFRDVIALNRPAPQTRSHRRTKKHPLSKR
jgi:beta-glucosidase/6-phospho-beta-glucosidase/beta-galactosidase